MKKGYLFTDKETTELFLILSNARLKCTGKFKTMAEKYWKRLEAEIIPIIMKSEIEK